MKAVLFRAFSRISRAICFLFLLALSVQAETPYYHIDRSFVPVEFDIEDTPTEYILYSTATQLTSIVKGTNIVINTNNTYAIEKQSIAVGFDSAGAAWSAATNYNGAPSNHTGKVYNNVGWVKNVVSTNGAWGAYIWTLQNQIAFQSSTSSWWKNEDCIPVAISNVFVGSLGNYGPMLNVVDIGPVIDPAFVYPEAGQSNEATYQVDYTNVFYEVVIPDIWINPIEAYACAGDTNPVQFTVYGTNIPQGVTWSIFQTNFAGHAVLQTNVNWHLASVTPGNVATNYKVRATSKDNTNFYDQVDFGVRKVDIVETNIYIAVSNTTTLHLTADSSANTEWEIIPNLQGGAYIEGSDSGISIVINAGSLPTNYTVKAYAEDLTNCFDTCTVTVIKIDIDTDTDNDGTIESDDNGEDQFEEYDSGRIICINGFGINTNADYLAEIKLAIQPVLNSGTAKLEATDGGNRIKVWTTTNKTDEITLPKTYDLSATNPPSSLFVDGIATGKVQLAWSYSYGDFACTDQVAMLIVPTISYASVSSNAYVWSSLPSLGTDDGTEFQNQIKDEGFKVTWFSDSSGASDTNFEQCTLTNYKNMVNAGAFTVISHGVKGKHLAVYAEPTTNGQVACDNWRGSESDMVTKLEPGDFSYVEVSSTWLTANWKSGMDANKTIAMWSICYSASNNIDTGEASVKEAAGGRWRSGYVGSTDMDEAKAVNERFLKRMNGLTDNVQKRTAGEAYENGSGYTSNVKMDGNDWTTLCPAPLADNAVFPDTTTGNRKGWGCIIFDTYMSQSYSANDALIKQSGCPTDNHRWLGNEDGKYGLGFDFDKTGGASTTMRAVADKCRNEGAQGRALDGDRIKPNGDNREWSY